MNTKSLAFSLLVLGSLFTGTTLAQAPVPVVETANTERRDLAPEIWVPGTVLARHNALISAEVDGRLDWVVEIGDRVQQGDSLATIDDSFLQLELQNNKAAIKRIGSDLAYQQRQIKRLQTLSAQNNTAKAELDAAQSRRDMLKQDLAVAQVAHDTTSLNIDKARVAAPFDGIIAERQMSAGEFIRSGQGLVRLVNTDLLEVSVRAPLSVSRYAAAGDAVRVRGDFSESTHPLRTIIPVGDSRSRMIEVRIELSADDWVIGEAVRVALGNGEKSEAVAVPRDALVLRNNGVSVFTVDGENIAHQVRVDTGAGSGHFIGVTGNLGSDAQVVIRGAENLRDGQEVRIIKRELAALN